MAEAGLVGRTVAPPAIPAAKPRKTVLHVSGSLIAGGTITIIIVGVAILAPLLTSVDPLRTNLDAVLRPPSPLHPFGTDDLGRDVQARTFHGAKISLGVGLAAVAMAGSVGTVLGLVSGYRGGMVDDIVMRLMDAILAMPALLLAVGIAAALGPKAENVVYAIGLIYVPVFGRLARAQVLAIKQEEYVCAARVIGASDGRVLFKHVLPNIMTCIVVLATLRVSSAILAEASLSFLGLGAQPPAPTWGSMVSTGQRYLENAPWVALAPGAAIFLCILGLSFLGEGIRDALDPRSRSRPAAGS